MSTPGFSPTLFKFLQMAGTKSPVGTIGTPGFADTTPTPPMMPSVAPVPDNPLLAIIKQHQNAALDAMNQQANMMPTQTQPMLNPGDAKGLLVGLLIGKALGAKNNDLNAGVQGFIGARQQQAQEAAQNADRLYKYKVGQLGAQADIENARAGYAAQDLARQDKAEADVANQQRSDAQWAREAQLKMDIARMSASGKMTALQYKALNSDDPNIRGMAAQEIWPGDQARYEAAIANSPKNLSQIAAANKSNADAEYTKGVKTGLGKAKVAYQQIANQYAPRMFQGKVNLNDAQVKWLDEKTRLYPEYLQSTLARIGIAELAMQHAFDNNQHDNRLSDWTAVNKPRLDSLQDQLKSQLEAQKKVREELDKLDPTDDSNVESRSGYAARLKAITDDISRIQGRMDSITGSLSNVGAVSDADAAAGNVPFAVGDITPSGTKATFMGAKAAAGFAPPTRKGGTTKPQTKSKSFSGQTKTGRKFTVKPH